MNENKSPILDKIGLVHLWKTITSTLNKKVDKIEGFGLSANDFTDEYKKKLDDLSSSDYGLASNIQNGLMSSGDKIKLDGIEEGANKYVHPTHDKKNMGLYQIAVDDEGHVSAAQTVTSDDFDAIGVAPKEHTHDLGKMIDTLDMSDTEVTDGETVITGQTVVNDDETTTTKYTRKPLATLWAYIKSKASTVFAAINHNHKIQDLEEYAARIWDATVAREKGTVLAAPQAADGLASFRKLDKNDVGLGNVDNVKYLPLTGGTMTGQIKRSSGGSWKNGRDNAALFGTSSGQEAGMSYNVVIGQKTSKGAWTIGNLSGEEDLSFAYTTDANYNAGKNDNAQVKLPAQAGTIITSATIGSQTVASAGNATTWAGLSLRQNHNTSDTWIPVFSNNAVDYILKSEIVPD